MKGTHELGPTTSRRGALGLIGGFAALAIGAAPAMHDSATLDVDVDVRHYSYADPTAERLNEDETAPDIDEVVVRLTNHGHAFAPLFFTWDQKRKGRHNWQIEDGPTTLEAGETAHYWLNAPGKTGRINAGYPAQITVFEKGEQRWASTRFTTVTREEVRDR
jgi:hypothetical protein